MPKNPERFILVEQKVPHWWETMLLHDKQLVSVPMAWEIIDRGANFVTWDPKTITYDDQGNDVVVARFASREMATTLIRLLNEELAS